MDSHFLKITDNGLIEYFNRVSVASSITGKLVGISDNEFDRDREIMLFIRTNEVEVANVVLNVDDNIGSEILRCLTKVDLNLPITISRDGIYQNGNRLYPLRNMDTIDSKALTHHYQMMINRLIKHIENFEPTNTDNWKYGSEYSLIAVSDCPYYYRGNVLREYVHGYIKTLEYYPDEFKLYLEMIDEDVALYRIDIIYPGPLAYELLNSLNAIDVKEKVMLGKEAIFQLGKKIDVLDERHPQDIIDEFLTRLNK